MREHAFLFGETKSLLGITTEPAAGAGDSSHPAVVLLNAGLVHRIGPNRLYVNTARRLADAGFTVLRFLAKEDLPLSPEMTFDVSAFPFEDPDGVLTGPSPLFYQVLEATSAIMLTKTALSVQIRIP